MSWSEVLKINSDMSKPLDTLISETVAAKGVVKSVQRGRALAAVSSGVVQNVSITISAVSAAKCLLTINNSLVQDDAGLIQNAYFMSMTNTLITLLPHYYYGGSGNPVPKYFSWQLVEFY